MFVLIVSTIIIAKIKLIIHSMKGEKIRIANGNLIVPRFPTIPFIEGDGTGPDIWAASIRVFDAAVEKAYNGERKVIWKEVYAGGNNRRFQRVSGRH